MKRLFTVLAVFASFAGAASAQLKPTPESAALTKLATPVVLAPSADLPDVAECRGILSQVILDLVNNADEDPADTFEANRRAHPHMIMMPPPLDCASKLWKALKHNPHLSGFATVPPGTEALSLRQYPVNALFNVRALSASVGSNVDPSNGVENYQGENNISIDPNNPLHIVAHSNTFYKDPSAACLSPTGGAANTYGTMALFGSTDGGATWTYNCAPWPSGASGGVPSAVFWFGSDPALAWDNAGRAYACYMLISENSSGSNFGASIVVARSSDNGASWQNLGIVINDVATTTNGDDKEMMAIDNTSGQAFSHPGRIYVIWDQNNNEVISHSDDGVNWTKVNLPSNTGAIGGNVVVGADGTVYVIWNRYNVETIVFSKSTDGGTTWTTPAVIATMALQSFGSNNLPPAQDSRGINAFGSIDVDRNPASAFFGNLYVSFPDFPAGTSTGADINAYIVRSTNGGTSWSSRVKVNDDNFGATQFFPWLAVDQSDGTVNVSWYDTRLDPINRKTQMVYARSSDGGVSFEPNILITDGGLAWRNNANFSDENSTDNTAFNGNQYGDYSGIAAFNRQVHPLWTDSRMFFPLADTQSPTRREDNATAAIINCSAPSAVAAPSVNPTTAPSVVVSWVAPAGWGTNATSGTYSVFRNTTAVFPGGSPIASNLTSTTYVDTTGVVSTTYFYFVRAKNNCPGTALTPMSTDSTASAGVVFGAAGSPVGTLQGTITSAGNPVSGATVTAGTFSATTNGSGVYQIAAVNTGTYTVSASATGYNSNSANGVVVNGGATTVQNLSLTPTTPNSCFTDTTFGDFSTGTGSNVEITSSPGDMKLTVASGGPNVRDQHADDNGFGSGYGFSNTSFIGQTFTPSVTASMTKIDASLFCASCSGANPNITLELRTTSAGLPVMTAGGLLQSATVAGSSSGSSATFSFTFSTVLTAGTQYGIVIKLAAARTGTQAWLASNGDVYAGGRRVVCSSASCSNPTGANNNSDLLFIEYNTTPNVYQSSGNFVSSVKDSSAVTGSSATWTTLSWTATTPANTTVKFQAAGSNNAAGPFNFVGPDGTAATFFTVSGASLAQFNGNRYLRYEAFLSTTDTSVTPTLSSVTVCEQVVDCNPSVPTITPTPSQVCASSTGNTASGPASMSSYAWSISNGTITSGAATQTVTYTAGASGSVVLTLTITTASGCVASNSATVTINPIPSTPTINAGGPTTFCTGGSVTLTSSSASGNQWYLNGNPIGGATSNTYNATAGGNYTVVVTSNGCSSAASSATTVTVNPIPSTPTINAGGPTTFCAGGSVTLTSSSASGNQWYLNGNPIGGATSNTYNATASGNYTVIVTSLGCSSAASSATTVTVNPTPSTPTINAGGPTTFCAGGSVTLTSSSASGNQWYLNGNPIGGATSNTYIATASGNYTVVVTANGCSSAASAATTVTVNPIPSTPTITPGGPTTFCAGGSVTLTSSSASGNQWYLNGNPIGGATSNTYNATASGDYTVVVTLSGCSSAPSAATTVTVNPTPATPTINAGGPTTFCAGGSVTLTSSSASGNQWYLDGNPIGGATSNTYNATASGNYTVVVTSNGCSSAPSAATTVTVNPIPATPTINAGGPTTFCTGGSVTLTSSSASGNQWYLDGNPIGGATNNTYIATASGNYTVIVTSNGCSSASSAATTVTVNPIPSTPTITPGGPTTFCAGGSVTLTSSSASGNQWYLNGNPIGGATNNTYNATASGNYTVVVTSNGCSSAPSSATTVTVNPTPSTPTINAGGPTTFCAGGSVTLTSSSASGNQWYLNGNPIGGATNNTYIATASGSYTVIVTSLGCSSAASSPTTVTVNPLPPTPTINAGGPTTFCAGGSVTLTSSSASGNQWYLNGNPIGGATNNTYLATASGNYTVVVTDGNGCTSSASAPTTVTVNPLPPTPTITPGGPTTFCAGGSVTFTSSSASGNQWYLNGNPIGGATNNTYIATASGDYTVVVTDGNGCSSAASSPTTVTVNPIPSTPTITPGGPTTFCAGDSVTLTSSSASGNQWYLDGNPIGGATANTYIATGSGNYTVVVTLLGCSSAASSPVTVTVNAIPSTPTITPGGPTTFCAGGSVTLTSSSASGNQWYLNGNPIGGATNNTYIATASGNYTVVVTSNGCPSAPSSATSVTVNPIPSTPTITPGGPTTFCAGGSVTLTSSSASGNQWYLNGNPIGGATNNTYIATASGNYTVVVTALGCSSAPSAATSVTVNPIPSTPTITPGGPTTFCTGDSVTLTSSSASGNQWYLDGNPIGGATNNTYIATASGNYTVVVTSNGCSSAASAATSVTVNPIPSTPTINAGGPTTFCAGDSVTLTSSGASGNQWYLDGNPIGGATNNTYIATASGNYTVVVTSLGCSSAPSAATTVTVHPIPTTPTINAGGPTTFCAGGSVTLTSSSASGNQWYLNGNPIGGATNNTYIATASGNYTVIVTTNGCSSAASAATTVTVNPIPSTPTINAGGPTTFCAGGSVTLTSSSASGNQWYLNGNPIGGATNNTYNATASGNYTTVIVTSNGCSSAASAATSVTVNPTPPTPTINAGGPTTFCTGGSVTLTSSSASGNQWYLDGNPIGGATNNTYIATASGNYTVVVTSLGCSSAPSAATSVTVNPIPSTPTINAGGPTTFCAGDSVTLTSSSASGNQWYLDGNPIGGATNNTYIATASGNYTVVVTSLGCSSAPSAATTVTVNPIPSTPTINAGGPTTFCAGGSVTLTSSSASGNQWYLNGNPIGGATNNTYIATASGNYTVIVTSNGCSSASSEATTVTVNPIPSTPTITPGGPTTFCAGGSVTLTSSSASGNQWYLDGNPIGGATNNTYIATASGNYTVIVTSNGCSSASSAATTVTVNPIPSTPTINAGGPTTFCAGGSVTLTSSSASGNQWYLNGNPIGGATNNTYNATASGNYTVVVTTNGCSSAASAATSVTVNPIPATPTINAGGPTTFCAGGSVTLTSSSASGNQWYLNGNPIGGATNNTYIATASGNYTVVVTTNGCSSAASAATSVTVNPIPATPTINAGGATTFCAGGSVTLTSSSASGNQWYLNGNPIGGATNNTYIATASGNYTVVVTTNGCASAASAATSVTVNPIPSTPTITPSGATTFCAGGSVTLTSSSESGNQWYVNGSPIGGATGSTYIATASGDYTVVVTSLGCSSSASATTTVTVNPNPNATITAPSSVAGGSTGNAASVASAGAGATYNWSITNGTITGGAGTSSITFTAGAAGTLTLQATVTTSAGCSDTKSANVTVTASSSVTVTSVTPPAGPYFGGINVTIAGTGFQTGATVTFGGAAATNVVRVSATQITAKTPAHAGGAVNVVVTNPDTTSGTLSNGYTYVPRQFDANGDNVVDPSDIFYLVSYLFLNGPAPRGSAGMMSGDANGDGVVDPADIFYIVNYLFTNGPQPYETQPGRATTSSVNERIEGSISLGRAVHRGDRIVVPVIVTRAPGSTTPQAMSLNLRIDGDASGAVIHRAGAAKSAQPTFEITRHTGTGMSYLVSYGSLSIDGSAVVAEIELARGATRIDVEPRLTMLSDQGGMHNATVANGALHVNGVDLGEPSPNVRERVK